MDLFPQEQSFNFEVGVNKEGEKEVIIEIEGHKYHYDKVAILHLMNTLAILQVDKEIDLLYSKLNSEVSQKMQQIEETHNLPDGMIGILAFINSKFLDVVDTFRFLNQALAALSDNSESI